MARIFVTGSTRGIGAETARQLIELGHEVVVHARNSGREQEARASFPDARGVDPGCIRTDMGGPTAPDPVELGAETQAWLATSDDDETTMPRRTASARAVRRGIAVGHTAGSMPDRRRLAT
ncbi:SDR family NAD(P)-dependent oxidoreductase [Demequina sp.]|uniref:SDR family NAD(P)-dependent oxidoreductase n=1 Tax=Demequina sp. TaxID=2050685 RepID=UPI0025C60F47|nr:SDR family NAD(P)-dependent oxidoreductase [Demequina sp.]